MANRPPSIGDGKQSLVRVRQSFELPETRPLIITEVGRILGMGRVQKLTLEVGKPIQVERLVEREGETPDLERLEAEDLYGAMRNNELITLDGIPSAREAYGALWAAFRILTAKKAVAKAAMASNWARVRAWLGIGKYDDVIDIFGAPIMNHEEVPDDVLVIVAADPLEPDVVKFSIRIPMDEVPQR